MFLKKSSSKNLKHDLITSGAGGPPEKQPPNDLEKGHKTEKAERRKKKKLVTSKREDAGTDKRIERSRSAISLKTLKKKSQPEGSVDTDGGVITTNFPTPVIIEKKPRESFFRSKSTAKFRAGAVSGAGKRSNANKRNAVASIAVEEVTENSVNEAVLPGSVEPDNDIPKEETPLQRLGRFYREGKPEFHDLCVGLDVDYPEKIRKDQVWFESEVLPDFQVYMHDKKRVNAGNELDFWLTGVLLYADLRKKEGDAHPEVMKSAVFALIEVVVSVNLAQEVKDSLRESLKKADLGTPKGRTALRRVLGGPLAAVGENIDRSHWQNFLKRTLGEG